MKEVYCGFAHGGRLRLHVYDQECFDQKISALEGKPIEVTLERATNKRTHPQNSYYWAVIVKMLSLETGHNQEEMHEILKYKFNPLAKGIVNKKTGEIEELIIGHTTTNLSTIEFGEYCEKIRAWAAEFLNVNIPEPNEITV